METPTLRRVAYAVAALASVVGIGTLGFRHYLHEPWLQAFYRAMVCVSLTGLDTVPQNDGARVVTIFMVLAGITILAYVGSLVVEAIARGVVGGLWAERRRRRAIEALRDHFIICGFGRVGQRVAEEFRSAGAPFVVLDFSADAVAAAHEESVLFIEGNGTEDEDLDEAGLMHARGLVAASDDDADNMYITLSAKARRPDLTVVARASDAEAEKKLKLAGADRVVTPYGIAGRVMASLLVKPQVAAFLNVVSEAEGPQLAFEQIEVRDSCAGAGKTIGDLRVRDRTGASIVAVRHRDGSFDTRPTPDVVLDEGDVLVGVGTPDEIRALEDLFAPREAVAR